MKNRSMCRRVLVVLVLVVAMFASLSVVLAQEARQETVPAAPAAQPSSDELALSVANAQKANQTAIMKFSWKVKTDLSKDGAPQATNVNEMRFNTSGKLESTPISSQSSVEKKPGFRGRQQERQMEDYSAYLQGVLDQSFQYIFMSKGTLVDVFDRAKIAQSDTSIDVVAGSLFVKDDSLDMSVDPASNLATKLSFKTTYQGDAIQGSVTFSRIENGPNRPAHLEIEIPAKTVKIVSETYDWIAQQ